jgi:hypothetical protein
MIAAIYARKSTEQTGTAEEARSVTRQIEHARAYVATKGWTVGEAHVYVDDGISGAEFAKRPGLVGLINALSPRPPFQVLVMSEEGRLGREQIETTYPLKQLITAGSVSSTTWRTGSGPSTVLPRSSSSPCPPSPTRWSGSRPVRALGTQWCGRRARAM